MRQRFSEEQLPAAAALVSEWLAESQSAVAFTGAGISTESGIPDFRSPGGVWSKYDPDKFEKQYFKRHPEEVWPLLKEIF